MLSRLENAVAKSSYVGQGKKLKVTNAVCFKLLYFSSLRLPVEDVPSFVLNVN